VWYYRYSEDNVIHRGGQFKYKVLLQRVALLKTVVLLWKAVLFRIVALMRKLSSFRFYLEKWPY